MSKFYASLCLGDGGGYVIIEAENIGIAREKMFASKYGKRWAFMYEESQFDDALGQFNQKEVEAI